MRWQNKFSLRAVGVYLQGDHVFWFGKLGQSWFTLVCSAYLLSPPYTLQTLSEKYYGHLYLSSKHAIEALIVLNDFNTSMCIRIILGACSKDRFLGPILSRDFALVAGMGFLKSAPKVILDIFGTHIAL